ncbi:MAG: lactate utilization protein [Candidatus Omnitrophica bacterium]|nr:lactate utilization protein [Candidatus Omnitrophota bacterium]
MDKKIEDLFANWRRRNIQGLYCANKAEAVNEILRMIPLSATVGISGSVSLDELAAVKALESRGNKVFNQYQPGLSRQESLKIRREGAAADCYLTGVNAISQNGELVFFSAFGNRTAGISSAENVIVVSGVNKLTPDINSALKRSREYAAPLNCKRLKYNTPCFAEGVCHEDICRFPEYKRMCCQVLIIEAEATPDRLKVILVNENLGF